MVRHVICKHYPNCLWQAVERELKREQFTCKRCENFEFEGERGEEELVDELTGVAHLLNAIFGKRNYYRRAWKGG